MKLLSLSLDKKILVYGSENQNRQINYSSLCDELNIIVLNVGKQKNVVANEKLRIYPTNSWHRIFHIFNVLRLGRKIIKNKNIELIIVQDPIYTGILGLILSAIYKKKLLVGIYGSDIFDPYLKLSIVKKIKKEFGLLVLNKADAIQTDGLEIFEALKKRYAKKVFLKPMVPTDIDRFRQVERKFANRLRVLYVGRMAEQKNIPMLVDVINKTTEKSPDITFMVIGDGPKRPVNPKFQYVLKANRKEMVSYFQDNDLLISTSFYEGFPRVFMEAAASGMPIITTKVSGIKYLVVEGKTGFIIPQDDTKLFVEKIMYLNENREVLKQMSENIRKFFDANLSFEVNLKRQVLVFDYLKNQK